MRTGKKLIINMAVMGAASLLMRTVSMSFQVYLTNKIGAAGVGIFQLIMSVYSFALTVAISGIRLATTRLVAEELAVGNRGGVKKSVRNCMIHAVFFGSFAAIVLFFAAEYLGLSILGDPRTVIPLKILAFDLPVTALAAVMNGYFTAVRKVHKSAAVQITDEVITIYITVSALAVMMPKGLEYACIAIVASSTISEIITCAILALLYFHDSRSYKNSDKCSPRLFGKMLGISLPVAVSAYARTGLNSLQHLLIPKGLKRSGADADTALAAYGTIHGMALPILLFPSVFLYTLSDLVVPEFAECKSGGNFRKIDFMVERLLRSVGAFSIAIAGIAMFFAKELSTVIYSDNKVAFFLRIFAPLVPIMYCDTAVDGMLKGLGEQVSVMRYNMADAALGTFLVLTILPVFGIDGYVFTIFITEIFNFFLSARKLVSMTNFKFGAIKNIVVPSASIALALFISRSLVNGSGFFVSLTARLVACSALGIAFYIMILYIFSYISSDDIRWFKSLARHA